jgi:squalene-hopene/tetraprenyl-beta-curcumene cyclase
VIAWQNGPAMLMTRLTRDEQEAAALASAAAASAARLLLRGQHPDGRWSGAPPAGISAVTADILLRDLMNGDPAGTAGPSLLDAAAGLIRATQRRDGSWAEYPGGMPDPAPSIAAYLVLRMAGDDCDAYHMAVAAGWIRDAGGLSGADAVTRLWLEAAGPVSQEAAVLPAEIAVLPAEIARLPWRAAAAMAQLAGMDAGIAVPLLVLRRFPARGPRQALDLTELRLPSEPAPRADERARLRRAVRYAAACGGQLPALPAAPVPGTWRGCAEWLAGRQDPDGSWARSAPATALSVLALRQLGRGLADPAADRGSRWLRERAAGVLEGASGGGDCDRGESGSAQAAPVSTGPASTGAASTAPASTAPADTELVARTLLAASLAADHDALLRARAFLSASGRLASERAGHGWPRHPVPAGAGPPARHRRPGEVADALSALCEGGLASGKRARGCVVWLLRAQRADGAWAGGLWTGESWVASSRPASSGADSAQAGDVIVTSRAVVGLIAAGVLPGKPQLRRACDWLAGQQFPDGGWPARGRSGPSGTSRYVELEPSTTATAFSIQAMLACGDADAAGSARRGIGWLARKQRDDGGWNEVPSSERGAETLAFAGAGADYSDVFLRTTCYAMQALSGYLRFTGDSVAVGGT